MKFLILAAIALISATPALACQVRVLNAANEVTWSGTCAPISADGILTVHDEKLGEIALTLNERTIMVDYLDASVRAALFVMDPVNDTMLLKIDRAIPNELLTRPLDQRDAALLTEARIPELVSSESVALGDWTIARPGKSATCENVDVPKLGHVYECGASLAIPAGEGFEAGRLRTRFAAWAINTPLAPIYYHQLGQLYDTLGAGLTLGEKPECEHKVVVTAKKVRLKVDFCVNATTGHAGYFDAILKMATAEQRTTALGIVMMLNGFSTATMKKVVQRQIESVGAR